MKKMMSLIAILISGMIAMAQTNVDAKTVISQVNSMCPATISDGFTLTSVEAVDKAIQYNYTLDDKLFANLVPMKDILHDAMVAELVSSPDPASKEVLAFCRNNGYDIIQQFTSKGGETIKITILNSEIK